MSSKNSKKKLILSILVIVVAILAISISWTTFRLHRSKLSTSEEACLSSISVAIYNDTGVWRSGIDALELYLKSRGIDFTLVNATSIKDGILKNYNILIMPGGWAYDYWLALGPKGNEMIKSFVKNGGGYLGICAGAYYAARAIMWEAGIYHYSLGIANLVAIGPKKGYPWPAEVMLRLNSTKEGIRLGLNKTFVAVYIGGPEFWYLSKNITVLALYGDDGKPAIVLAGYGKGRVALSGVHLEVRESTWQVLNVLLDYLAGCKK